MFGALHHVAGVSGLVFVERPDARVEQQFGKPDDGVERRAQFVRNSGDELTFGVIGALGALALALSAGAFPFGPFAFAFSHFFGFD